MVPKQLGSWSPCIFCFCPSGMLNGLDKRGRPYFSCRSCGTRAFLNSPDASNGPGLMAMLINLVGSKTLEMAYAQGNTVEAMMPVVNATARMIMTGDKKPLEQIVKRGEESNV